MTIGETPFAQEFWHILVERRLANRHRHNPVSRRRFFRDMSNAFADLVDRSATCEGGQCILQSLPIHVRMSIDQPWNHETASCVNLLCLGTDKFCNRLSSANSKYPLAFNGNRLSYRTSRIKGYHLTTGNN